MRFKVTVTPDEVCAALRAWLTEHGIPAVSIDSLTWIGKSTTVTYNLVEVTAMVDFEVDALSLADEMKARAREKK